MNLLPPPRRNLDVLFQGQLRYDQFYPAVQSALQLLGLFGVAVFAKFLTEVRRKDRSHMVLTWNECRVNRFRYEQQTQGDDDYRKMLHPTLKPKNPTPVNP